MTTQMRAFTLFSALFAVVYVVCVEMTLALVTYHPRLGQWDIGTVPARTGPAMYWFGWLASAGLAAALATLLATPLLRRIGPPVWIGWAVPLASLLAFFWFLRSFFLR